MVEPPSVEPRLQWPGPVSSPGSHQRPPTVGLACEIAPEHYALVEVDEPDWWLKMVHELERREAVPAAQANASLLRRVQDRWQNRVVPRTSMHDLLFTLVGDPYPFRRSLRVAYEGEFEFRLLDHDELQKAERCGVEDDAVEILDRLLGELTASA